MHVCKEVRFFAHPRVTWMRVFRWELPSAESSKRAGLVWGKGSTEGLLVAEGPPRGWGHPPGFLTLALGLVLLLLPGCSWPRPEGQMPLPSNFKAEDWEFMGPALLLTWQTQLVHPLSL